MKEYYYIRLLDGDILMSLDLLNFNCKWKNIDSPPIGDKENFLKEHLCDDEWEDKGKLPYSVYVGLILNNQIIAQIKED